jgi:hypothetical protein
MSSAEADQVDYGQTLDLVRGLTDVRFRLLAFVPTICGAAVAFLSRSPNAAELLAVGAIGLVATLGVVVYDLRNTQVYDYAVRRAGVLESRLGQTSIVDPARPGGLFTERPAGRDRGFALVYGAAVGGWSYLVAWGALHALGVGEPQKIGGAIGVACGVLVLIQLLRER